MKIFLTIASCLTILLGLKLLILPIGLLQDLFTGDTPLMMILTSVIPHLLFAYLAIKYPVAYLRKGNESTANPIAIIIGIVTWSLLITPTNYLIRLVRNIVITDGDFPWPEMMIFLPVLAGMYVTRLLQSGIRKSFPKQNSEQAIGHSQPLTEPKPE